MPTNIRTLGVHAINGPTKKSQVVTAAAFNIGGIIGQFERKYLKAFSCSNPEEQAEIFGGNISPNWYANDTAGLFWKNLAGNNGRLYIKAHVGYDGTAVDAVVATSTITDQNGLASALALANDLKTQANAHAADATKHTTAVDSVNFPVSTASAYDLTTLLDLTNALITAYVAHDADAALASAWAYHAAQESPANALASSTAVTDMASAIAMLNDMKTKYNAHDSNNTTHGGTAAHQVSAAAASASAASTLKIEAAYQEEIEYGSSGNRTAYKIIHGSRFSTALAANVAAAATSATLDSVIGITVGDIVTFSVTGGAVSKQVTVINESLKTISWSGAFHGSYTGVIGDTVSVPGFKIETYRKSLSGIVTEVETDLGDKWCTMEATVPTYYVQNIHAINRWLKVTDQASASSLLESFPNSIPDITYMTAGADGTSPTTSLHWAADLTALDELPIRFLCNPETSNVTIQKAGEAYCKNRRDNPIWITVAPDNQTQAQLKTLGQNYQRSDDVIQVVVADWIGITDPFNASPIAVDRYVPNVGAVMGAWVRCLAIQGIHFIPATDQITLLGVNSVHNSNLSTVTDQNRTDIASYGVNLIQAVPGGGIRVRNFFTPSTTLEYQFANALLMRNYLKVSCETSLASSENYPNSFARILEDKNAILNFYLSLWYNGSTGAVPSGETFGQSINSDGTFTDWPDHIQVQADLVNNPQAAINRGERNIDSWFTFPAPTGSIQIRVGFLLR